MYKQKRSLFGRYNVPAKYAGSYDPSTQAIDIAIDLKTVFADRLCHSYFVHECIHYWQGISTTYGFYYAEVASFQIHFLLEFIKGFHPTGLPFYCPFRDWAQIEEHREIKHALQSVCRYLDVISSHLRQLEGGDFDADVDEPNEKVAVGDWNLILAFLEHGWEHLTWEDVNRDRGLEVPGGHCAPIIQGKKKGMCTFGAAMLAESFALACQLLWLRDTMEARGTNTWGEVVAELAEMACHVDYALAREIVVQTFPDIPHIKSQAYYVLPLIADLALNGPLLPELRPLWSRLRGGDSRLNWRDVHPGFRFVEALVALRDSRLFSSPDPQPARKIIEVICDRLRWPTPVQTAKEILRVMSPNKKVRPDLLPHLDKGRVFALDLYDFRLTSLNKACALRVHDPDVVSHPSSDVAIKRMFDECPPIFLRTHSNDRTEKHSASGGAYAEVADVWDAVYAMTIGFLEDPSLLRHVLESEEGQRALKMVFKIELKDVRWL